MNQTSRPQASSHGSYRWWICSLLFFATTINYADRSILAFVKPVLDKQLGWTNEEYGVVNSLFQGAYAIGLLGFGWLIDRVGTKIGYAFSIAAWSLSALAHSLVGSVMGFKVVRVALGLGESGNFPSAIKTVAQWFPKRERAFATALFNSGANVAQIFVPAIVPLLTIRYGWQSSFVLAGVAGLLWLGLWWIFYETPQRRASAGELAYIESDPEDVAHAGDRIPWLELLGHRQTWAFIAAKALTDPIWWFFLIWLPDYFHSSRGLDMQHLGAPLVVVYCIVTVLSISGGWLSNFLVKYGWTNNAARKLSMLVFALCVLPILFVKGAGLWSAVALIGLAGAAHQAWSANLFTTASDMFPKKDVASVVGIGGMAGSITGIFFPTLCGIILDHFKHHISAGYGILFGVCSCAYLLAFVVNHLLAPRFEMISPRR